MSLQLEYSCSEKDMKEAKDLRERENYGGGPKWRSNIVMFVVVALMAVATFLRFKREIAPEDRGWFITLVVVTCIVVFMVKRLTRAKTGAPVRAEVSERGIVFNGKNSRTELLWAGFSKCLESPNLFVLMNRSKSILYVVPKRAFPDEPSQEWFRTQINQPRAAPEPVPHEALIPGRFLPGNGVGLAWQPRFRDQLNRHFTSWRLRAIFLGIFLVFICIGLLAKPAPDDVNSPAKATLIFTPILALVFVAMLFFFAFLTWFAEKKDVTWQKLVLTNKEIQFASGNNNGHLPWSTYKYYRENRWSIFVWNPQASLWFMIPKRAFGSPSDLEQCRALLRSNLKLSRWFFL